MFRTKKNGLGEVSSNEEGTLASQESAQAEKDQGFDYDAHDLNTPEGLEAYAEYHGIPLDEAKNLGIVKNVNVAPMFGDEAMTMNWKDGDPSTKTIRISIKSKSNVFGTDHMQGILSKMLAGYEKGLGLTPNEINEDLIASYDAEREAKKSSY